MKRLIILAAVAAVSALALTGGASAGSFRMSEQDKELCRLLELAHESTCTKYEAKLVGDRNWIEAVLDASNEATGSIAAPLDETGGPVPQSLAQ